MQHPPKYTLFPYTTLFRSGSLTVLSQDVARDSRKSASRSAISTRGNSQPGPSRSEEHTSALQSRRDLVCRLLLVKKKEKYDTSFTENVTSSSACEHTRYTT